jgi:hypothetical protein
MKMSISRVCVRRAPQKRSHRMATIAVVTTAVPAATSEETSGKKNKKNKEAAAPPLAEPTRIPQQGQANSDHAKNIVGIDIGGSGIKGCVVNVDTGELIGDRIRVDTPQPATPSNCLRAVMEIIHMLNYKGPVGITFPAVVTHGVTVTAANVDRKWVNFDAEKMFRDALGDVCVLNDADAAGVAEVKFGAGKHPVTHAQVFAMSRQSLWFACRAR